MLNGMELVDFLRETENKMIHIHRAIDHISNDSSLKESVTILTAVVKDYQAQIDKVKSTLSRMEYPPHKNQQHNSSGQYQDDE
ncbi:hypothetical protein [Brevibacillus daliensis]|uniref:hypothetical protein n=1 Tax=Brevibacillus daliensis TaxID=2892995 RepID=UPI001E2C3520|nr:hypothetical protein [Brevibacillus daliensis]